MRNLALMGLFAVTGYLIGAVFLGADLGHIPWYISRASGLIAFVLLSFSVILGLLISTKAADRVLPRPLVFDLHQFLSVLVLSFTGVHIGSLLFDGFLRFTPMQLVVPFAAPYRPFWTGIGVLAAWSVSLITASFWARKRIGQRNWRRIHYLSFAAYLTALGHGAMAGTDSGVPLVILLYVGSFGVVMALLIYRIHMSSQRRTAPKLANPRGARARKGKRLAA